ncbi:MAG: ABC transporter substrate-binding protein [Flavobacteriales bacterium]
MATLFLLGGCSSDESTSDNVFCYNESNGITSLDPAFSRDLEVMWATNQLFDGLVELDSAMNVTPCIAHSWEISEDGKTYTFHLRDEVYFHPSPLFQDSTHRKVMASDFVYSFARLLDKKLATPAQWIFATVDTSHNRGFEAPDDSTFCIYLKEPFQPFLGMLTMQYCNVVPREVVEHFGADFRSHPIGTGPFRFAFWYENMALVFHKHPAYWKKDTLGNSLPYLDAVKIDFVKDMSVEFQGLLQGKYDFISGIHDSYKDEILDSHGNLVEAYSGRIAFQKTPFIKTDYLGIFVDPAMEITRDSPLLNKKIRQALSYAIDKKEMVRYLRNNSVFPADHGFVPPALLGQSGGKTYYTYSPEKAKALLQEAGFPNGKGLPEIEISTTSDYADLIEFVQHQLSEIGVKVRVNILQGPALREQSAKGQLAVFRKSWLADYADAENFLAVFYSPNFCPVGPNYTHFKNAEYDALYVQARSETNDEKRMEIYSQMDSILMSEAPVIPLLYDQVSHFVSKRIVGLKTNPVNMLDLKDVKKLPR